MSLLALKKNPNVLPHYISKPTQSKHVAFMRGCDRWDFIDLTYDEAHTILQGTTYEDITTLIIKIVNACNIWLIFLIKVSWWYNWKNAINI